MNGIAILHEARDVTEGLFAGCIRTGNFSWIIESEMRIIYKMEEATSIVADRSEVTE